MELKIGEIFEYNGEWYQCLEEKTCTCFGCDFRDYNCDDISLQRVKGSCQSERRKDNKSVIFKKLEKVGEPYEYFIQGMGIIMVQEYILANANYIWDISRNIVVMDCQNGKVAIEIKQTKEDMEEKNNGNTPLNVLTDKYVNGDICYDDFEKEVKALYSCKEEIKPTLKEFDLEAAKAGKPVCTRDGRKARIICFDIKDRDNPIVAAVDMGECEIVRLYTVNGKYNKDKKSDVDLMMLSEKKEGWVNIYSGQVYNAFEKAEGARKIAEHGGNKCLKTIKINWEE